MVKVSKCSKKCNEIKTKIDSISGLDDDYVYNNLLELEKYVTKVVDSINKYADEDELNGTCFKVGDIEWIKKKKKQ